VRQEQQLSLNLSAAKFGGATFVEERDGARLLSQLRRTFNALKDSRWHTLSELAQITGDPPASVSARLRDLRKPSFGNHVVERRYVRRGLFEYRLRLELGNRGD
jgi:hypothetical protein